MNISIIIPARLESTRLKEKVLLPLGGKTIIQWVYDSCKKVKANKEIYIATDHEKIARVCKNFGGKVIMTNTDHLSGTDRCAEVAKKLDSDVVINVQGDEPFIDPAHIQLIIDAFKSEESTKILTLFHPIKMHSTVQDPGNVKLVVNKWNKILYFSRSVIPYPRNDHPMNFYQHIGIYGFRRDVLLDIAQLDPTPLERKEGLEQLRWMENGYDIYGIEVDKTNLSIDTPQDYDRAKILAAQYSK